jgi:SlyX protein
VTIDKRLIDIELKLTAQEDLTQALSQQVYRQQKQIDELRALCGMLLRRLEDSGGPDPYTQEKPPHY